MNKDKTLEELVEEFNKSIDEFHTEVLKKLAGAN